MKVKTLAVCIVMSLAVCNPAKALTRDQINQLLFFMLASRFFSPPPAIPQVSASMTANLNQWNKYASPAFSNIVPPSQYAKGDTLAVINMTNRAMAFGSSPLSIGF